MKKNILIFLVFIFFSNPVFSAPVSSVKENSNFPPTVISVTGKIAIEEYNKKSYLVLHSTTAKTYILKGNLTDILKNLFGALGKDNLTSIKGKRDNIKIVHCKNLYKTDSQDAMTLDICCFRYYNLEVVDILYVKKSSKKMPHSQRDRKEEKKMRKEARNRLVKSSRLSHAVIGEMEGKISSVNLKSPIKTINVSYRDKNNTLRKRILSIGIETRIVKKIDKEKDPLVLTMKALKPGQKLVITYSRDEHNTKALFITILE